MSFNNGCACYGLHDNPNKVTFIEISAITSNNEQHFSEITNHFHAMISFEFFHMKIVWRSRQDLRHIYSNHELIIQDLWNTKRNFSAKIRCGVEKVQQTWKQIIKFVWHFIQVIHHCLRFHSHHRVHYWSMIQSYNSIQPPSESSRRFRFAMHPMVFIHT